MKLGFAILADVAQAGADGKVSIIGGGFDTIRAAQFPVAHPSLSIAMEMVFERDELDREHRLRIMLMSPLGATLFAPPASPFTPHLPPDLLPGQKVKSVFVVNIAGILFESPGTYRFRIIVDDKQIGEIPLYATRMTPTPEGR